MDDFTHWRGFDLTMRQRKLERACACPEIEAPDDLPMLVNTPCYFAFGSQDVPPDYFTNPASMLAYQTRGYERHLKLVQDDYIPYFMPWFGTGVLASAFGCRITLAPEPGSDPAVAEPCISSPTAAARLKLPDPQRDGWMPRVLETIDYARAHGDLPVGLTDMQGPLDTLGLMCGQAQLYQWMYQEPRMVHELFALVTEAFIQWAKVQKEHIGEPLDRSNGLQGIRWPVGIGIWESDDDLVLLDAGLYREFVVPYVSRIFSAFGSGSLHFCGNGLHHADSLLQITNLKVVSNSPMGNFAATAQLKRRLSERRITLQIQDAAPEDIEAYYTQLYAAIGDLSGLVVAPFVLDTLAMDLQGGYRPVVWDPFEAANRIVAVTRSCVRKWLAGEPLLAEGQMAPRSAGRTTAVSHREEEEAKAQLSEAQMEAIKQLRERLVSFDGEGLRAAVHVALQSGLSPFAVATLGMAEGMAEVGRRYEAGEFFLPQLVMAGVTMREGMRVLEPLLKRAETSDRKGTVVIGTVQGDLHDIGKNIVRTMLEAAGFVVHDIGVDQPADSFVNWARRTGADIVAMSALLTTTMPQMARVIVALKEAGLGDRVRVMVGGAPISREFADRIGAEGYAPDAVKAVREAERLMALTTQSQMASNT